MTAAQFEDFARRVFSEKYGAALRRSAGSRFPKTFDLVSEDVQIVGDAKYYTLVRGRRPPPAKWATIAEHVWFLEKVRARERFLVFGNDIRVPKGWLERWGKFVESGVMFFFLHDDGTIEELQVGN